MILLRFVIGWNISRHFFDQLATKAKQTCCMRFPALSAGCRCLLWVMIGSFDFLCLLSLCLLQINAGDLVWRNLTHKLAWFVFPMSLYWSWTDFPAKWPRGLNRESKCTSKKCILKHVGKSLYINPISDRMGWFRSHHLGNWGFLACWRNVSFVSFSRLHIRFDESCFIEFVLLFLGIQSPLWMKRRNNRPVMHRS